MNRRSILFTIIAILILGGIGGFVYIQYRKYVEVRGTPLSPLTSKPLYQEAEELHHRADPGARQKFEQLLAEEQDPNRRAYIEASIASELSNREGIEGKKAAVERVKKVIADPTISNGVRAGMINALLDIGSGIRNLEFMEKVFFAGEPYQDIYNRADRSISRAMRFMWEWSIDLFPTSYAHLQLAHWYGLKLMREDYSKLPVGARESDIQMLKDNLAKGEALIDRDRRYNSAMRQASLQSLRAANYGILALQKEGDMGKAEEIFKKAIAEAELVKDDIHMQDLALGTRIQYAVMISDFYGPSRKADACAILKPFAALGRDDLRNYTVIQWVVSLFEAADVEHPPGYTEPYPTHTDLYKLGVGCPEMKAFVENLTGKTIEQLLQQAKEHK